MSKYIYPKGDFISGFSKDDNNPCEYELMCQKMIIKGCEYIEKNPEYINILKQVDSPHDKKLKPLIDEIVFNINP